MNRYVRHRKKKHINIKKEGYRCYDTYLVRGLQIVPSVKQPNKGSMSQKDQKHDIFLGSESGLVKVNIIRAAQARIIEKQVQKKRHKSGCKVNPWAL